MKVRVIIVILLCSIITLQACATNNSEFNSSQSSVATLQDPLEKVNRVVFSFNIIFDKFILRPIAITYRTIVPGFVRDRITYSLNNLGMPITAVNNVLQGELRKAGVSTGRFIINSTVGVLGFFDPAASIGLISENEGVTSLPPDSVYPVFLGPIFSGERIPTNTFLELGETTEWYPTEVGREQFTVVNRNLSGVDTLSLIHI